MRLSLESKYITMLWHSIVLSGTSPGPTNTNPNPRNTRTIVGQGGPAGAKEHQYAWAPPWDTTKHRHLFGTQGTSLHSLAGPKFHTSIQIALSFNHILLLFDLLCIKSMSKRDSKNGSLAHPAPPNEMQGVLAPLHPNSCSTHPNPTKFVRNFTP